MILEFLKINCFAQFVKIFYKILFNVEIVKIISANYVLNNNHKIIKTNVLRNVHNLLSFKPIKQLKMF